MSLRYAPMFPALSERFYRAVTPALTSLVKITRYQNCLLTRPDDARQRVIAAVCDTLPVRVGDRLDALAPAALHVEVRDAASRPFATLSLSDYRPGGDAADATLWLNAAAEHIGLLLAYEDDIAYYQRQIVQTHHDAVHDGLTELLNRRGWDQALAAEEARCQRYDQPGGVVMIDLDGLKQINDRFGHAAGDELIRRAAATLNRQARENDVVARLGGDELIWLLVDADQRQTCAAASRLQRSLRRADVAASVGFSVRPMLGCLDDAVRAADAAMYADKKQRRLRRRGAGAAPTAHTA